MLHMVFLILKKIPSRVTKKVCFISQGAFTWFLNLMEGSGECLAAPELFPVWRLSCHAFLTQICSHTQKTWMDEALQVPDP